MSRVRRYSRSSRTHPHGSSPTGLSPAPAGRSRTVPLTRVDRARGQSLSPAITYYPHETAPTGSYAPRVWAPPVSLAATPGILSFPRGTEMFQFPRCPPAHDARVTAHHGRRVAPFGDRGITGCQPLPRAFRRVAASFLGCRRQGIHRPPILAELLIAPPNAPPSPTRAILPVTQVVCARARSRRARPPCSFASRHGFVCCTHVCNLRLFGPTAPACMASAHRWDRAPWDQVAMINCQSAVRIVETNAARRRLPHAGGAAGTRTPDLRRAKAALSQLSYGPLVCVPGAPARPAAAAAALRWARLDSNQGPRPYQGRALTS